MQNILASWHMARRGGLTKYKGVQKMSNIHFKNVNNFKWFYRSILIVLLILISGKEFKI